MVLGLQLRLLLPHHYSPPRPFNSLLFLNKFPSFSSSFRRVPLFTTIFLVLPSLGVSFSSAASSSPGLNFNSSSISKTRRSPFPCPPQFAATYNKRVRSTTTTRMSNNSDNNDSFTTWNEFADVMNCDAIIPPLSKHNHKGSQGRVAVLGGSERYTGAPYYAAMAALRTGSDLATVLTAQQAVIPIKTYSPELMVQAVYSADDCSSSSNNDEQATRKVIDEMVRTVKESLERMHCLVIGPGLGRNPVVLEAVATILQKARQANLYMVLDADALFLLAQPEYCNILKGYDRAVLTPNVMEYQRLMDSTAASSSSSGDDDDNPFEAVTIVEKGLHDKIMVNNKCVYTCQEEGGLKRPGGIGDVLSGAIGTFVAWHCILSSSNNDANKDQQQPNLQLACWSACCLVKRATKRAFAAKRRAMSATDVLAEIGATFEDMTSNN